MSYGICGGHTVFQRDMWWRVVRTEWHTSPHITEVFFSSYKLAKSWSITVVWSCNISLWVISLYFVYWRICLVITPWIPSDHTPLHRATGLSIHSGSVRRCCASDSTSGSASQAQWNFTLSCIQNFRTEEGAQIGAGSLHSKGSVNGASNWKALFPLLWSCRCAACYLQHFIY